MGSFEALLRSTSNCVHFIYSNDADEDVRSVAQRLKEKGARIAYVNCEHLDADTISLQSIMARQLNLQHSPYGERASQYEPEAWVPFLDDLITLANQSSGLVIVIDSADILLSRDSKSMLEFIEIFLIQIHHWLDLKKPCHLLFQMVPDERVADAFQTY